MIRFILLIPPITTPFIHLEAEFGLLWQLPLRCFVMIILQIPARQAWGEKVSLISKGRSSNNLDHLSNLILRLFQVLGTPSAITYQTILPGNIPTFSPIRPVTNEIVPDILRIINEDDSCMLSAEIVQW